MWRLTPEALVYETVTAGDPQLSPDGAQVVYTLQSEQMFVALKQAGCEVEFARYPGGAHAMLPVGPPSHRADFLQRLLGWFTDHLT